MKQKQCEGRLLENIRFAVGGGIADEGNPLPVVEAVHSATPGRSIHGGKLETVSFRLKVLAMLK